MLKVAIIGRPNVGKSTLFNRLIGRRAAIVSDVAGTTRDVKIRTVKSGDGSFELLDTAGIEHAKSGTIGERMSSHSIKTLSEADFVVFMADARVPPSSEDKDLARMLLKSKKPFAFALNKAEDKKKLFAPEYVRLGLGEPILMSAEHDLGIRDLLLKIEPLVYEEKREEDENLPPRLAIIGRPNVGKSTLFNAIVGAERVLTGPEAGITRDSIDTDLVWRGQAIRLIDTAGLRKRARVEENLEKLSNSYAIEAVKNCDACIIVVDAAVGLDKQDLIIANLALDEGKGLLIALNKIDKVADRKEAEKAVRMRLESSLSQIKDVPLVEISARQRKGIDRLLKEALYVCELRSKKIPTAKLNKWLEAAVAKQPPPMSRLKRPMRLKYMTQTAGKPPSFTIFAGGASNPPDSYMRYLENSLKSAFGLQKIMIRLKIRTGENPYKED